MVEFTFVAVILFLLLLGIVSFGVLLAFKQNMTQAASEAARASIAVVDDTGTTNDERVDVAEASMAAAVSDFDRTCDGISATCEAKVHECDDTSDFTDLPATPATEPGDPCLTTWIEYDNSGAGRILPPIPLISAFEPDSFVSQTTVRLVPVEDLSP